MVHISKVNFSLVSSSSGEEKGERRKKLEKGKISENEKKIAENLENIKNSVTSCILIDIFKKKFPVRYLKNSLKINSKISCKS